MQRQFTLWLAVAGLLFSAATLSQARTWRELLDQADSLSEAQNQDSAIVVGKLALEEATAEFGAEDTAVASVLNNLGVYSERRSDYLKAEELFKRALAILERVLGLEHLDVSKTLNNLGVLYWYQGNYAESELHHKRVLAIREKVLGPGHPDVARSLNNLGLAFQSQGRYAESESAYRRAMVIREKTLDPEHEDIARSLTNLGLLLLAHGKYIEAESLLKRSVAIWEKARGPEHRETLRALNNLAVAYVRLGKYAESELTLRRVLTIKEKVLGPENIDVARGLINLGGICAEQGKYTDGELAYKRAQALFEKILGDNHNLVAQNLQHFSRLRRLQGNNNEALKMAERANQIRRKNFIDNAMVLAEKDALSYGQFQRRSADDYLSCFAELGSADSEVVNSAASIILCSKGEVSDGIFERQKTLVSETDSTTMALAESFRLTRFQLSKLFVEGPGDDLEGYRGKVDSLAGLANNLEAELSRHSAGFRTTQQYKNISVDRIASALPKNSVLIEYLKYNYIQLKPDSAIPRYLATVLIQDEAPVIVDLGNASEIDSLVAHYRRHMLDIASAIRSPTVDDLEDYHKIGRRLCEKVWEPIERHLSHRKEIFIAPDGGLNMVSFAGLIDNEWKYLIEDFSIQYLSSGRDLIRLKDRAESGSSLFALGDPDYNASAAIRVSVPSHPEDTVSRPATYAVRNVRSGCSSLREMTVDPLPGTRDEVRQIATSWSEHRTEPTAVYLGADASEEKFKAEAPGSRVIHLATHGYFLEGSCQPKLSNAETGSDDEFIGENPLLLSGLFFAGANLHGEGAYSAGAEDGVLTAYEVSGMNLQGTDVVVLSACETALGDVQEGEGVYGLRRAFQMAGARTVISSLWRVPDDMTATMMASLYDASQEQIPRALRSAALKVLKRLRKKGQPDHPYSWAAFIAIGDWRGLD